ncbi:hypothetical protein NFI96_019247, partial [Prochilodus magdalenae]
YKGPPQTASPLSVSVTRGEEVQIWTSTADVLNMVRLARWLGYVPGLQKLTQVESVLERGCAEHGVLHLQI